MVAQVCTERSLASLSFTWRRFSVKPGMSRVKDLFSTLNLKLLKQGFLAHEVEL
jgi:hypothetical protein